MSRVAKKVLSVSDSISDGGRYASLRTVNATHNFRIPSLVYDDAPLSDAIRAAIAVKRADLEKLQREIDMLSDALGQL